MVSAKLLVNLVHMITVIQQETVFLLTIVTKIFVTIFTVPFSIPSSFQIDDAVRTLVLFTISKPREVCCPEPFGSGD